MAVVILDSVSLHYGEQVLLEKVNFTIQEKDRLCLVGRNGAGKSSLIKLLLKQNLPDGGVIRIDDGTRVAELPQTLPAADDRLVMDVVLSGKEAVGKWLHEYHELSMIASTDAHMKKLEKLQHNIEAQDGWLLQQKADAIIEKLNLPAEKTMAELSGGWRRRVMLARALLSEPDLLLLDEPTNHLDLEARHALTMALQAYEGAVVVISHDRHLLRQVVDKYWLVANGKVKEFEGDLQDYQALVQSLAQEQAQAKIKQKMDAKRTDPQSAEANTEALTPAERKEQKRQQAEIRKQLSPLKKAIAAHEKDIDLWQAKLDLLEAELALPSLYQAENKAKLKDLLAQQAHASEQHEHSEEQWLEKQDQLESMVL